VPARRITPDLDPQRLRKIRGKICRGVESFAGSGRQILPGAEEKPAQKHEGRAHRAAFASSRLFFFPNSGYPNSLGV
jgi:hypothetical protein